MPRLAHGKMSGIAHHFEEKANNASAEHKPMLKRIACIHSAVGDDEGKFARCAAHNGAAKAVVENAKPTAIVIGQLMRHTRIESAVRDTLAHFQDELSGVVTHLPQYADSVDEEKLWNDAGVLEVPSVFLRHLEGDGSGNLHENRQQALNDLEAEFYQQAKSRLLDHGVGAKSAEEIALQLGRMSLQMAAVRYHHAINRYA